MRASFSSGDLDASNSGVMSSPLEQESSCRAPIHVCFRELSNPVLGDPYEGGPELKELPVEEGVTYVWSSRTQCNTLEKR